MPGWFPRRWIDFIIAIIVLWLLIMVAIDELETVSIPISGGSNLA